MMGEVPGVVVLISCLLHMLCGPLADGLGSQASKDECLGVQCPEVKECESDSYRLPSLVDTSHKGCCPPVARCQCNPGLLCPPPHCPQGWSKSLVLTNKTGTPGHCCPLFQCVKDKEGGNEMVAQCSFRGSAYPTGASWRNDLDCTDCYCNYGVTSCKPVKCDLQPDCRMAKASPDSGCCPICIGCVASSGLVYNNTDVWKDDECTTCECVQGRVKCHASMCQRTCLNPRHVSGECCPRCESDSAECPFFECELECPHGFQLNQKGCPTCKCNKCRSLADCALDCLHGYETNELGCAVCECRAAAEGRSQSLQSLLGLPTTDNKLLPNKNCLAAMDGVPRLQGEEWSDNCRHCICKEGAEMCSLITCLAPSCEHPVFHPGDCCPTCPDDGVGEFHQAKLSVCQSSDGLHHVEGEVWEVGGCLTCTCHYGQVLCAAPACPPTPCPESLIQMEGDCCFTCFPNSSGTNDGNAITNSSNDSPKLNCISEDSDRAYADGEMWKVGACQSCICQDGQIQCFSGGKCPALHCDRPVLAKNQCCPLCLSRLLQEPKTKSYDPSLCNERNTTYDDGESWDLDSCTRCSCRAGQIHCVETVCSFSDCRSPVRIPGKCCPICSAEPGAGLRAEQGGSESNDQAVSVGLEGRTLVSSSSSPGDGGSGEPETGSGGLEPHCAIIIASLLGLSLLLLLVIARSCFFRRRIRLIKKATFHSASNSPPVTPDCCYKYTTCAQLSEQKTPLCHNTSSSSSRNNSHHPHSLASEKV